MQTHMLINGEMVAGTGEAIAVLDPSTGEEVTRINEAGQDQIEAAKIDGASRWEQVRYVVIPHIMPLVTFVALIQLMDKFRVFEEIVGFHAEAHATSLSWFIFNDLGGETRLLSSAAATSVMTIIGVAILLLPVLIRTWRDFKEKTT